MEGAEMNYIDMYSIRLIIDRLQRILPLEKGISRRQRQRQSHPTTLTIDPLLIAEADWIIDEGIEPIRNGPFDSNI
jgi:hypothetical protein